MATRTTRASSTKTGVRPGRVGEPDQLGRYLNEIAATPLLTAADEVSLAKRIEAGVYAAELLRAMDRRAVEGYPETGTETANAGELSATRAELAQIARDGERAKDHMIRANLRLVVSAAKRRARHDTPMLDVIQDGNLGLIHAVEKFDYAKGYKFSTYAMWWIRQAIQRGDRERSRTIRLPAHVADQLSRLRKVETALHLRLGHEPTMNDLASEAGMSAAMILELRGLERDTVSLDSAVGIDSETKLVDLIADTRAAEPPDTVDESALAVGLAELVGTLPARDATIIALRYGLGDGRSHTLREIGERLGVSEEQVRRLEKGALGRLRDSGRAAALRDLAA
ncbi:MAG TPA: sigma-70 family RNA polymerase sigma factor [Pseudonocardiaceae bacterium]